LFSALTLGSEVMTRNGFSNEAQAHLGAAAGALVMTGLDSPTLGLRQAAAAVRARPEGAPSHRRHRARPSDTRLDQPPDATRHAACRIS
jgi:hypothetical protein